MKQSSGHRPDFHDRLNQAAGEISYRKLGRLTETHPETVRRYMQGQAPSATFLTNMCRVLGISGEWLLTGRGPMRCAEMRSHALSQADPSELMTAVANTLTDLCDRMDRLERFVQQIETRMHGQRHTPGDQTSTAATTQSNGSMRKAARLVRDTTPSNNSPESGTLSLGDCDDDASTMPNATKPDGTGATSPESGIESKRAGTSAQRIRDAIAKRPS